MDNSIPNSIEQALNERLDLIKRIQSTFLSIEPTLPFRHRRSTTQKIICGQVGIPCDGYHRRIVNEALSKLGVIHIAINGERLYRRK
jgi:hypothetical protein